MLLTERYEEEMLCTNREAMTMMSTTTTKNNEIKTDLRKRLRAKSLLGNELQPDINYYYYDVDQCVRQMQF